jgi:type IV pilus assembly protein PilZ
VHFSDDESGHGAKRRIEGLLGGLMQSTRSTHTY